MFRALNISKMFYILVVLFTVIAMGKSDYFADVKNNLTLVTWEHAVNNISLLDAALNGDKMMLEADVVLGTLSGDTKAEMIPIMAHPPLKVSDLSLKQFLNNVTAFNDNNKDKKKGIKLDFKSIEAFNGSVSILKNLSETVSYPIWLNADILPGPVNSTTKPVNAEKFIQISETEFKNIILSIGWTTNYNMSYSGASYTEDEINNMIETVVAYRNKHQITFPVRAGLAAESLSQIKRLLENVTMSTLTIWSSEDDPVDVSKLQALIMNIGVDKVYIDVPMNLSRQLNLDSAGNRAAGIGILSLTLSTIIMILTSKIL